MHVYLGQRARVSYRPPNALLDVDLIVISNLALPKFTSLSQTLLLLSSSQMISISPTNCPLSTSCMQPPKSSVRVFKFVFWHRAVTYQRRRNHDLYQTTCALQGCRPDPTGLSRRERKIMRHRPSVQGLRRALQPHSPRTVAVFCEASLRQTGDVDMRQPQMPLDRSGGEFWSPQGGGWIVRSIFRVMQRPNVYPSTVNSALGPANHPCKSCGRPVVTTKRAFPLCAPCSPAP